MECEFEILIKSFIRFDKLDRLVESVRRHYPGVVIRIADDSPPSSERDGARQRIEALDGCYFYTLPFNVGICVGRNFLIRQVQTRYFVMLDDDLEFTSRSSLERLQRVLDGDAECAIAAGTFVNWGHEVFNFHGHLEIRGTEVIRYVYGSQAPTVVINGVTCVPCTLAHNFFMGSSGLFRRYDIRWDDRLKVREHIWFFLNLPKELRVYYVPGVTVDHWPGQDSSGYRRFRRDREEAGKGEALAGFKIRRNPVILYESRARRLLEVVRKVRARVVRRIRRERPVPGTGGGES